MPYDPTQQIPVPPASICKTVRVLVDGRLFEVSPGFKTPMFRCLACGRVHAKLECTCSRTKMKGDVVAAATISRSNKSRNGVSAIASVEHAQ